MDDFANWVGKAKEVKEKTNIIYTGAILTKESQNSLFQKVNEIHPISTEWKCFCHHVTIRFRPKDDTELIVFGDDISLIITELFKDEKCITVRVEPNSNKQELNMPVEQIPHITIATAPGISPVYSNDLLRKEKGIKMPHMLSVEAFLGAKLNNGTIVPERSDVALENFTLKYV